MHVYFIYRYIFFFCLGYSCCKWPICMVTVFQFCLIPITNPSKYDVHSIAIIFIQVVDAVAAIVVVFVDAVFVIAVVVAQ